VWTRLLQPAVGFAIYFHLVHQHLFVNVIFFANIQVVGYQSSKIAALNMAHVFAGASPACMRSGVGSAWRVFDLVLSGDLKKPLILLAGPLCSLPV
jgi:hypothetical protein